MNGKPNISAKGQNQFGLFPRSNTLNWCYDSCFDQDGIWIADTGNSQFLWYTDIPGKHDAEASNLIGQNDFKTGSENNNTIWSTKSSFYYPSQVSY